jgi:hypothetical protein
MSKMLEVHGDVPTLQQILKWTCQKPELFLARNNAIGAEYYLKKKAKMTSLRRSLCLDTLHDWLFCTAAVFWFLWMQSIPPIGKGGPCSLLWSEMNMGPCGVPLYIF